MEYTYPKHEKGAQELPYNRVRYWEVNKADIYSALAQVEKEDKLSFPKLLEKIRKEMQSESRGSKKERENWERYYNQVWNYSNGYCCVERHNVYRSDGKLYVSGSYDLYEGPVRDYWYSVLGYGERPRETYQERESALERMVCFE